MVYGEAHAKAHGGALGQSIAPSRDNPREAYTVADAIDGTQRVRNSLGVLADLAEGLLGRVAGPTPQRATPATGEASLGGPQGVVDRLHYEIREMSDPLTRIEFALRDIDARIG